MREIIKYDPSWLGKGRGEDFVQVVPAFNAKGVCRDYDRECFEIPAGREPLPAEACFALCWSIDKSRGQCPFVD